MVSAPYERLESGVRGPWGPERAEKPVVIKKNKRNETHIQGKVNPPTPWIQAIRRVDPCLDFRAE
jgi:hypothetical protein